MRSGGTVDDLALAELAHTERFDRGLTWAETLEAEHDNLRAALDYLQDRDPGSYLQLAGASAGSGWEAVDLALASNSIVSSPNMLPPDPRRQLAVKECEA
jgi:hypothetical protein